MVNTYSTEGMNFIYFVRNFIGNAWLSNAWLNVIRDTYGTFKSNLLLKLWTLFLMMFETLDQDAILKLWRGVLFFVGFFNCWFVLDFVTWDGYCDMRWLSFPNQEGVGRQTNFQKCVWSQAAEDALPANFSGPYAFWNIFLYPEICVCIKNSWLFYKTPKVVCVYIYIHML